MPKLLPVEVSPKACQIFYPSHHWDNFYKASSETAQTKFHALHRRKDNHRMLSSANALAELTGGIAAKASAGLNTS
jgi:hypothetical protein